MPVLTEREIAAKILTLPPHLQSYAIACWRQIRPPAARPVHQRSAEDQALYDACRWDLELFATTFFPHWCTEAFSAVHLDYYRLWRERAGSRGHRDVTAAPRGSSKTTGCAVMGIMHACVYAYETFIVYLTNTYDNAEDKVKQVRDELEANRAITRVYGSQVGPVWNQADFTTSGGVRVLAAARNSQVRGITKDGQRPTKIVCDDVEHPDYVLTEAQRIKTDRWFKNDILKLGQPKTNIELSGTILHPESLLATMLKNPGWRARFYQAVLAFADESAVPLWEAWRQLFIDLSNPDHMADARAFFEANHDAMLAGTEVLWPERRPYYDLMVSWLVDGESSFWSEDMNQPRQDSRYLFEMDTAGRFHTYQDALARDDGKLIHFLDMVNLAAYWDPTPDRANKTGDYSCCSVGMRDKYNYNYIVDCYCAQESSTDIAMDAIVDMLWRWQVTSCGIEINGFASLLPNDLRRKIAEKAQKEQASWNVTFIPIKNVRNKILRIKTLEPMIVNKWLWFADNLPLQYIQQFADFIATEGFNKFDDGPDSVEGLLRVLGGLFDRRAAF